jgi:uncharacterized membrane protein
MRNFFVSLRNLAVAGFFFLLPVIVVFIIIEKAFTSLTSVGKKIATVFGVQSAIGVSGSALFTGLLLVALCLACGLLMRYSFIAAFGRALERTLSKYIPAYDTYKVMAEEKLQKKVAILPYESALVKHHDCWQPAYVVERDQNQNYVLFLPDIPDTSKGRVILAQGDRVRMVSSIRANELDESLKKLGKGLLSELRIQERR